jgi:F0F1-type ATP synthase assembly protein I
VARPRLAVLAELAGIGLTFPASTVAGYFAGQLADRLLRTSPTLSYVGAGLGIVGAFMNLFRIATRADADGNGTNPGG